MPIQRNKSILLNIERIKGICRKDLIIRSGVFFLIIIFTFLFFHASAGAQQINNWKTYTSFSTVTDITRDKNGRFWIATSGGVYSYENDSVFTTLTTLDGLSGLSTTAMGYDPNQNRVILGYLDGTIDLVNLDNMDIQTHNDIKRAERFSSRGINDFAIHNQNLYVATDFGIVLYNLENMLVQDSFVKLGDFSSAIPVKDVYISNGRIYSATTEGIAVGDLNDNLGDPTVWINHNKENGFVNETVLSVIYHQGKIYASTASNNFVYQNNSWDQTGKFGSKSVLSWQESRNPSRLFGISSTGIYCDTLCNRSRYPLPGNVGVRAFLVTANDPVQFWIGTRSRGIVHGSTQNMDYSFFKPKGPWLNFFNDVKTVDNALLATSELAFPQQSPFAPDKGYYVLRDKQWENFNMRTDQTLRRTGFKRAFSLAASENYFYLGSWGRGIARHNRKTDSIKVFNANNSNLEGLGGNFIVAAGLDVDSKQNVWATSFLSDKPLFAMKNGEDTWIDLSRYRTLSTGDHYFHLYIDSFDQKWISLISKENNGRGLLVLDTGENIESSSDDQAVKLTENVNNGNLPNARVQVIREDKDGEIWVGTARGIARFILPERVIRGNSSDRRAQWLINADTTADSPFLLRDVNATAMAVNAANQKWIGSSDNGVWLVNEDGSRILEHFNKSNSPLLSNQVNGITIDQETGTVYFSTAQGLVSYTDVPKAGVKKMNNLNIYPNPFSYNKHQQGVIIGKLGDKTTVRILTIDGRLVEEINAAGGRIMWDGKDGQGRKVASGVYLVVAIGENGDKAIGKLSIVR